MNSDEVLNEIRKLLSVPVDSSAGPVEPPDVPTLSITEIDLSTLDIPNFIQRDGSTWTWQTSGFSPGPSAEVPKHPICLMYGYISKRKDLKKWEGMVRLFGGDEARLQEVLSANGALARYKMDPQVCIDQGPGNGFFMLSMLLASPAPPMGPTQR